MTLTRNFLKHSQFISFLPRFYSTHSSEDTSSSTKSSKTTTIQANISNPANPTITTAERRSQFLHAYRHANKENYLGKEIVANPEIEGKMRGSIIYGWVNKFLVPEEFLNHDVITSEDGISTLYKIHKAYGILHHLPWKWNMDVLNKYEIPDEVRMACFMADNFDFDSSEEKELLQAYANELYEHYSLALDCEHISSIANDLIDRFRNTYSEIKNEDLAEINSLVEKYSKLLNRVKGDVALSRKIENDVGTDLVFLISFIDIPTIRNSYPNIFKYM